jgi:Flp pilus assembly protein TadD
VSQSSAPLPAQPDPGAPALEAAGPGADTTVAPASGAASSANGATSPTAAPATAPGAAEKPSTAEAESLTEQGIHLCRTARWRNAIDPLRRATELDPTNAAAFYYLGDACNHTDSLASALEAFEAASRLQPGHWRALKGIGIVLDRMRRPQEAAAAYQRAREAQHKVAPRLS